MFLNRVCVLVLIAASVTAKEYRNELVLQDETRVGSVIKTTPPSKETVGDMPENYDLRGTGLLTTNLNQHIPVYCGSCWAHAALSSIADRIKIANKGQNSDIVPSIQALINCGTAGTCNGGDSNAANQWVYENGIPDVTCQQYEAKNKECSAINTCMNCDYNSDVGCYAVEDYPVIKVSEFGTVYGDENIMAEIYARGPVSAYINANCIEDYDGGINMYDTCPPHLSNHAIQLNGWGSENGTDYWIGRNSWGSYWGENGMFRIVRGGAYKPNKAFWAVPEVPESMLK